MLTESQKASLKALFPAGQVFFDLTSRLSYELDAGVFPGLPDALVVLNSAEDAQHLVVWAGKNHVPLVARGAGTGLTGGAVASQGGIVVSFARLKAAQVDEASRLATVQPGLVNQELQRRLAPSGLIFPPDPASYSVSTIGGNVAENAGGPHCLKYGVTGSYVHGLEVVLADGSCVWFGGACYDPPEYNFTSLLTGSEGALGLITRVVLGLRRPAAGVKTLTASFAKVADAGQAVSAVIAAGLTPATIELMDHNMINLVEDYLGLGLLRQAAALLIFDVEGYPEGLDPQLDGVAEILARFTPLEIKIARTAEEREALWLGRRSASGAVSRISPSEYTLDVCVLRSRLAEALQEINAIGARYKLPITYLAHAGDGNLHPGLLCDLSLEEDRQRVHHASDEILRYCARIGGSIGGEHGIGIEKRGYLPEMYSPEEISAMQEVKRVFDPASLLNPGKLFPAEPGQPATTPTQLDASLRKEFPAEFEPASPEEAAAGLRALQAEQRAVRIVGRAGQWRGDAGSGVRFRTQRLSGILSLARDDFYVIVRAGTSLEEVQFSLSEEGFWLAAESPWPQSSLGGLFSTNLNSPLRLFYGGWRDHVLAVQVALADGRLLRFGRPLMKDVAGFQMNKLFCGAFGTLGVLTELTLRIYARPLARRTLGWICPDPQSALRLAGLILKTATIASGLVITPAGAGRGCTLAVTLDGHPTDTAAEANLLERLAAQLPVQVLDGEVLPSASRLWANRLASSGCLARLAVSPSRLPELVNRLDLDRLGEAWVLDAAHGLLYAVGQPVGPEAAAAWLAGLRQAAVASLGYAVLGAGPRAWLPQIQPWGSSRPPAGLMRALKLAWDPMDCLNRAEFI